MNKRQAKIEALYALWNECENLLGSDYFLRFDEIAGEKIREELNEMADQFFKRYNNLKKRTRKTLGKTLGNLSPV